MFPNTEAALDDAADLAGSLVGTLEGSQGLLSEISTLISNTSVRSDLAGLMVSLPSAITELTAAAAAGGGVLTLVTDSPEFVADAKEAYAKFITALAAAKGVTVVTTTSAAKK